MPHGMQVPHSPQTRSIPLGRRQRGPGCRLHITDMTAFHSHYTYHAGNTRSGFSTSTKAH
eukprot:scaffold109174_cov34-Tisochrysis_lutea.AAC.5